MSNNDLVKGRKMEYSEEILEKCLPKYLEEDLKRFKEGLKNKSSLLDCLICELQDSINGANLDNEITEEQCDYLYNKYIYGRKLKNDWFYKLWNK